MAFTQSDLNYYKKNPSHITADLSIDLLLELIDYNAENIKYVKPQTFELIQAAYEKDPSVFKYVDTSKITIQFLEKVITNNPIMIQHLYSPSPEIMKLALARDLNVLPYIEKYLDNKMYEWLLSQNGLVLEFIPSGKQTEKMVMIALQENVASYQYAHVKTKATDTYLIQRDPSKINWLSQYWPELIEPLVRYNPRFITKFYKTPEFVTKDIIKIAISGETELYRTIPNPDFEIMQFTIDKNLDMFEYMPYNQQLIDYAIQKNGLALKYVKKKDLKTIKQAIEQNVKALDYIDHPRQFLIDYAFKLDGYALKYVANPTFDQCMDAVKRNPFAIEFVPADYRTKEMQLYALQGGVKVIPFIGTPADDSVTLQVLRIEPSWIFQIENPTDEMFSTAFAHEGRLIMFYYNWNTRFNTDIIAAALSFDGTIFEFVINKSKKLALVAIGQYAPALQWTIGFQDLELAKLAVNKDPRTIFFVEGGILDASLLELAISLDPEYFTRTAGTLTWEQWLEITGNA